MGAPAIGVIAAQAAISGAQAYMGQSAAKSQYDVTKAGVELESAQTELEISRAAANQSEQFRRDLASQLTLASYRGGAGMARQFAGQSYAAYGQDMLAFDRARETNQVRKQNQLAQAQANKFGAYTSAYGGALQTIIGTSSLAIK